MRLAVILPADTRRMGGVQRYSRGLLEALRLTVDVSTYRLHPAPNQPRTSAAVRGVQRIFRDHKRRRFDAVLTTFHWPMAIPSLPTFGVIHDLRSLHSLPRPHPMRWLQTSICRSWRSVLVPSPHVASEVVEHLGPLNTAVVFEGVDHLDELRRPQHGRRLILVLGGDAPHKRVNLGVRSAVIASSTVDADVAVVGASKLTFPSERVRSYRSPSDADLASLYGEARIAVAASEYEGFGLAAGEALRFGVPVVYATDGPLGFLVRNGGVGSRPTAEDMAEAIISSWHRFESLSREAQRDVEQLTWQRAASLVLDVIRDRIRGTTALASSAGTPTN
jgi:glycosyltransferase involved in cell wall biosynthesis